MLAGSAAAQRERVDKFYLRSRNSQRNQENRLWRTIIHTYVGGLHLRTLTSAGSPPMAGIP